MLRINFFLIFLFFCTATEINAQKKITKKQFIADSIKIMGPKLARPQFRFDNRSTFFNNQKINITGIDGGVMLKNKLRITLGFYSVSDKLTTLKKILDEIEYQGIYKLNYGSLNIEFIYKNHRFFSLGMPLEFGLGSNSLNYQSEDYNLQTDKQSGFIAVSYFGLSGTFKPIRWIGLKGAVGYRKTLFNQVKGLAFDGVYTSLGLDIDLSEIIKDCKMYRLTKKYRKTNLIETAVDLITD